MATVYLRKGKKKDSWRVFFRRKGLPFFSATFCTQEEAIVWAKENERKYIEDSEMYKHWIATSRYAMRLDREFTEGVN